MTTLEGDFFLVEEPAEFSSTLRIITINRPDKRNALTEAMVRRLIFEIEVADSTPAIRALIITGTGDLSFCAGADLSTIVSDEGKDGVSAFGDLFLTLENIGVPVIAAVNGVAVGGGLGIVLSSDIVVMSDSAQIGSPEVKRGLFAMFITRLLYRSLPEKIANQMLFTGIMLSAQRLLELNVVNELCRSEHLLERAMEMAKPICNASGAVLRTGKRAIRRQHDFKFDDAMRFLDAQLKANLSLKDSREGILAFLEKRSPHWTDS